MLTLRSQRGITRTLEQLARAKEAWYEHTVEKTNKVKTLRQQLSDANADRNDTNNSLDLLRKGCEEVKILLRYTAN